MFQPIDPFQGGELDRFEAPLWSPSMNDLGLVKTVARLEKGG